MKCNVISQRIILQEYLIEKEPIIQAEIEQWLNDEEKLKTLDKNQTEKIINDWLSEFQLIQPSKFFKDHPTNDTDLICSI